MEDLAVQSVEKVLDMVEVVCGNKSHLIPVGKLAARSQFFARAFEVPMVEKMERKVVLKDFDEKIFEKVVKYIVEDLFLFDIQTEAGEALEAADRLDVKELKDDVCSIIKENLDLENAKAVLFLADKFNTKELFHAAFEYMEGNDIKLEKHDIVENPGLALAFMEECGAMIKALKKDLSWKNSQLEEKEELVKYYRSRTYGEAFGYLDNSFDYDDEDWHVYDSLEEVDDEEEDEDEDENEKVECGGSGVEAAHLIEDEGHEQGDKEFDGKAGKEKRGRLVGERDGFYYLMNSDKEEEEAMDGLKHIEEAHSGSTAGGDQNRVKKSHKNKALEVFKEVEVRKKGEISLQLLPKEKQADVRRSFQDQRQNRTFDASTRVQAILEESDILKDLEALAEDGSEVGENDQRPQEPGVEGKQTVQQKEEGRQKDDKMI